MSTEEASIAIPSHPHLTQPYLYLHGISSAIADAELMQALCEVTPARPVIDRSRSIYEPIQGHVEFGHASLAEKAYAIAQNCSFGPNGYLTFSMTGKPEMETRPNSKPYLIKQLPDNVSPGYLYDLFRRFGPLFSVRLQYDPSGNFGSLAVIEYYDEAHARVAAQEMHCSDVDGSTITMQPYEANRGPIRGMVQPQQFQHDRRSSWAEAPSFVPVQHQRYSSFSGVMNPMGMPVAEAYHPIRRDFSNSSSNSSGSSYDLAAMQERYKNPGSDAMVDPRNLFCKDLDPNLSSKDLFHAFKIFGKIVSARVMRDEQTGDSKGYGFVSFSRPEEAANALTHMNGAPIVGDFGTSTAITVRFHEPRNYTSIFTKAKERSAGPRQRGASFDGEGLVEDITRRVRGLSPPSSPRSSVYGSPDGHPLRPLSMSSSSSGDVSPRFAAPSISGTITPITEKDKLAAALEKVDAVPAENKAQIVDLLLSLPKKDKALCLFNPDVLAEKAQEALTILTHEESAEPKVETEDKAKEGESAVSKTPPEGRYTAASLGALSAVEIIKMASSESPPECTAVANAEDVKSIDDFIDEIQDLAPHDQKQKVGDKVFKIVKSFRIGNAPKITIHLLDNEDLRALTHLALEQPQILKEKILALPPLK